MAENGSAPSSEMVGLLRGFQVSQALYVIAELGVATILEQEGPRTVAELAERTGADGPALARLVRVLVPVGVFATAGDDVAVTPMGATLSVEHPCSVHALARMWMETHYLPFSELSHSVRTGRPGAEHFLQEPFFDWLARDARREGLFSRAMADLTASRRSSIFDGYRPPDGEVIADIGGSDGSVLIELLRRADGDRRGIVFDRPAAAARARDRLATEGLSDRVAVVAGDFFAAIPRADVYVLSHVLHDWDDRGCEAILGSVAATASAGARVLVIEAVIPEGDGRHLAKDIDLTMLGMLTGRERSTKEYRDLLGATGFVLDRVVETASPYSILEGTLS